MIYPLRFLALLLLLLPAACQPVERAESDEKPYFDLKAYFESEAERLAQERGFEKTVRIGEEIETQNLDTLDWATEFKAFADADINYPSWFGKYAVDSSFTVDDQLERLTYTVQDTSLRTKFIQVDFSKEQPSRIEIRRTSRSPLAATFNELRYEPDAGYVIRNRQQLRLAEEKDVEVEVKW